MSKEKPILFSTPMVKAILAGHKTMTRRVIKKEVHEHSNGIWVKGYGGIRNRDKVEVSPWKVSDILWVRETWNNLHYETGYLQGLAKQPHEYVYRADKEYAPYVYGYGWRPSLFMPKEAARIFLEVTSVRIERLHDISEADSKAEGAELHELMELQQLPESLFVRQGNGWAIPKRSYKAGFYKIWESINNKNPRKENPFRWDNNPWVWVIEFRRIEK